MKKQEKPSLAAIGQIVAIVSLLVYIMSIIEYGIYISHMNLGTMMSPASNPQFNLATQHITIAFSFAATAFILTILFMILEIIKSKSAYGLRKNTTMVTALTISIAVLIATVTSGATPFYDPSKAKAETINPKVEQLLKNDVDVKVGTPGTNAKAVTVTVTNKRSVATDYIIVIDALDKGGHRMAEDSVYTIGLKAHDTEEFKIFYPQFTKVTLEQLKTATFKIVSITRVDRKQ